MAGLEADSGLGNAARFYSLRTAFQAGPAGREAGCGQGCPPYIYSRKPLASTLQVMLLVVR